MALSLWRGDPVLKASIPQAFKLHGILGKDANYATDSEDDDDAYSDYDSEDDSEVMTDTGDEGDLGNEDGLSQDDNEDDENGDEECDQEEPFLDFTILGPNNPLITQLRKQPDGVCSNSFLRPGLWLTDPKVDLRKPRRGFLFQLANVCFQANLHKCAHEECVDVKRSMDQLAPACNWKPFREWALTAMSCQASMDDDSKLTRAHTHIARAVSGCFKVLKYFLDRRLSLESNFDNDGAYVELSEVVNLMYWMTRIQAELGTPPAKISDWDHHFLPFQYTIKAVQRAAQTVESLGICKNRLWNLVNVSDRKHGDLPDIVIALSACGKPLAHKYHETCTPSKCQGAQMDSTKVGQLHKCEKEDCEQKLFPVELLVTNIEVGKSTAWLCNTAKPKNPKATPVAPQLNFPNKDYIAISHVWSDGTGVGVKAAGSVNECLFSFFAGIAAKLDCKALWWDAISIPQEPKARNKALSTMHSNYANAKYTVVHDRYLLNFPWKDDGSPCLALVLSTWFTRGWTALELAMSQKVKVMFKDPDPKQTDPIIKDLDEDILAQSPQRASRAHWLATCLVQRLRRPVEDVGDLIAVLAPRSTSWARDRTIIASLLAGVPGVDFSVGESVITRQILEYLGRIPYFCLLHGKPTMRELGGYSWSAATLDDMPVEVVGGIQSVDDDTAESMLEIDDKGSIWGVCACRVLEEDDVPSGNIKAYGDNLAATIKVNLALADWESCLLVRPSAKSKDPRCLLVVPIGILKDGPTIKCRYIGTVLEDNRGPFVSKQNILIGGRDRRDLRPLDAQSALYELPYRDEGEVSFDKYGEMIIEHEDQEKDGTQDPTVTNDAIQDTNWTNKQVEELADQLEQLDVNELDAPEDLNPESLVLALHFKNKSATRFLVSRGITIDPQDLVDSIDIAEDEDEAPMKAARCLGLLGDVYMENGLVPNAIEAYRSALARVEQMEADSELSTTLLQVHLSLGRAYLVHRQEILLDKNAERMLEPDACVDEAKKLFSIIVSEGEKRGNFRTVAVKKPGDTGAANQSDPKAKNDEKQSDPSKGLNRRNTVAPDAKAAAEAEESTRRDERRAIKFLRLELDAAAELVVLAISEFNFAEASNIYRKAIRHFGDVPDIFVFEGFKPRWIERKTAAANVKEARDKSAASIYHRTLKRLSTLFKKHHLLILVTSLHLGVNYSFRSELRDAAIHLSNALHGLTSNSEKPGQRHESYGTQSVIDQDHPLIALTRYHLGQVFLGQERFKKAKDEFESALKIIPQEGLESRELRNVTKLALADYHLKCEQPDSEEATKILLPVIIEYEQTLPPTDDVHFRLVIEAQFIQAKAVHASIHEGRDQDNMQACTEAIQICNTAMQNTMNLATYQKESDLEEERFRSFLSKLCEDLGQLNESQEHREKALEILKKVEGEHSLPWLKGAVAMVRIYGKLGDPSKKEKSEDLLKKALKGFEDDLGEYSTKTLQTCQFLGQFYLDHNETDLAETYCTRAFEGFEKARGSNYKHTFRAAYTLGGIYFQNFKYTKAKDMLLKAHNGFSNEARKQPSIIHTESIQATMELADCYAALGGPNNERIAIDYYDKALKYLLDHGESESHNSYIVRLRQGNLRRQLKEFDKAQAQIEEALAFFNRPQNPQSDPDPSGEIAKYEALMRLGELFLDMQRSHITIQGTEGERVNPEDLVNEAQEGLEQILGEDHLLTLQATILRGEICLDCQEHEHPEPQEYLYQALMTCKKLLPPGTPTTIRIMDRLINYWADTDDDQSKIEDVKKMKWEALTKGYGADTAVAIMKMTDLKRENLFSWDDVDAEDEFDNEEEEFDEEYVSEDEDLSLWNQGVMQNIFAGQNQVQEHLGDLLRAGIGFQTNVVHQMIPPVMVNGGTGNVPDDDPDNDGSDDGESDDNGGSDNDDDDDGSADEDEYSGPQGVFANQQQPPFATGSPMPQMVDQRAMSPQALVQPGFQNGAANMGIPQMMGQAFQDGMQQFAGQAQMAFGGMMPGVSNGQPGVPTGFGFPGHHGFVQDPNGMGQQDMNSAQMAQGMQCGNEFEGSGIPNDGQQVYMNVNGNVQPGFGVDGQFGGQWQFGPGPYQ